MQMYLCLVLDSSL